MMWSTTKTYTKMTFIKEIYNILYANKLFNKKIITKK